VILAKTPLRVPLAGGLSDLAPYAERFGGETLSVTIDKHVYVTVKDDLDGIFDIRYRDSHERTGDAQRLRHDLLRESLVLTGLADRPLDVDFRVDLAGESGLGTSGALTVSILHALRRLQGIHPDAWELLHDAARVEVERLAGASGFHDPAICALGGLRRLGYDGEGVRDLGLEPAPGAREAFADALLLFYSGRHAKSKPSLDLLTSHLEEALPVLHDIRALVAELAEAFETGDLAEVARCVGEQQRLKQRLPGRFVDEEVERLVGAVRATGAEAQLPGGKISAFVLVVCPDGQQEAVRAALPELREVPVRPVDVGTRATEL
jgi:D-glycero-alpha-D-manno-heptose-7-phosphate kinase